MRRLLGAAVLGLLVCGTNGVWSAPPEKKKASVGTSPQEEIYTLGKDALSRGAFETANRLLRCLESDPRWSADGRYCFNHAQASRYAGEPGEAVYWYGRYLAAEKNAPDARAVTDQIARLVKGAPQAIRQSALMHDRETYQDVLKERELERALSEAPNVSLRVRFIKVPDITPVVPEPPSAALYVFPGHAIFWNAPADDSPEGVWRVWLVASMSVAAPEDSGAPPLLMLPSGRPFAAEIGTDLTTKPTLFIAKAPPFFPEDPDLALWRIEVTAQVERLGPPLFVSAAKPGAVMVEVKSGPAEELVAIGKKRRDAPAIATAVEFGPRAARSDSKALAKVPLLVLDLPGKDAVIERWGAPIGTFDVVNRFARMVEEPPSPPRFYVRAESSSPFLTGMPLPPSSTAPQAR
jgi:hypothetical protein